jgi:hypothetical protein
MLFSGFERTIPGPLGGTTHDGRASVLGSLPNMHATIIDDRDL